MYSFDNLSSSPGSISSALALPVSRGRHRKLVDNFSHESDVTSLQDPFTSRPYKTPFYFYYLCSPWSQEAFSFKSCRIFAIFSTLSLYSLQFTPPRLGLCFPSSVNFEVFRGTRCIAQTATDTQGAENRRLSHIRFFSKFIGGGVRLTSKYARTTKNGVSSSFIPFC